MRASVPVGFVGFTKKRYRLVRTAMRPNISDELAKQCTQLREVADSYVTLFSQDKTQSPYFLQLSIAAHCPQVITLGRGTGGRSLVPKLEFFTLPKSAVWNWTASGR